MEKKTGNIFSTSELPIAAYIKAKNRFDLTNIDKSNLKRITWSFDIGTKEPQSLIAEYFSGGTVSAMDFYSEIRTLKSMVY